VSLPAIVRAGLAVLLLFGATLAAAQTPIRIAGRVIGPDSAAIVGQNVVLHRVTSAGGTLLAQTVSAEDGTFTLESQESAGADDVYFVAARYEDRLYIGPMMRLPLSADSSYILQVGVPERALAPVSANPAPAAPPGGAAGTPRRWFLLLVPLGGLLALLTWLLSRATGPSQDRRILIRIAELDNAWDPAAGDRTAYERTRQRLIDQLHAQH
jgi:hypothetical protein